jgi:hypothetical protein
MPPRFASEESYDQKGSGFVEEGVREMDAVEEGAREVGVVEEAVEIVRGGLSGLVYASISRGRMIAYRDSALFHGWETWFVLDGFLYVCLVVVKGMYVCGGVKKRGMGVDPYLCIFRWKAFLKRPSRMMPSKPSFSPMRFLSPSNLHG